MRVQDQPAFVLHRRQYSESSLLLDVYTPDYGRIGLIARGARGSKSALPALLQPFQELRLDFAGIGDLQRLNRAEPVGVALSLRSERALAGLYCNELIVRLVPRNDPHQALYERYRQILIELSGTSALAWCLRRFERDLLDDLGYAADFANDASGSSLDPNGKYQFAAESGFVAVADRAEGFSGHALLAMLGVDEPLPEQLRELRRLFRALISEHLRGEPLRSWALMAGLSRTP